MSAKPVLDVTAGGRQMWFDKRPEGVVFCDRRSEDVEWDTSERGRAPRTRHLEVRPDLVADFTALPFADSQFHLVVFDPPHLERLGKNSRLAKKYGVLLPGWEIEIAEGFRECWRVLAAPGTLIFKWCSLQVPLATVLELASPLKPLFGHHSGKHSKTHWMTFFKP